METRIVGQNRELCRLVKQQAEHTGAMRDLKRSVDEIKGLLGQLVDARQPEA